MSKRVLIILGIGIACIIAAIFLLRYELTVKDEPEPEPEEYPEEVIELIPDKKEPAKQEPHGTESIKD